MRSVKHERLVHLTRVPFFALQWQVCDSSTHFSSSAVTLVDLYGNSTRVGAGSETLQVGPMLGAKRAGVAMDLCLTGFQEPPAKGSSKLGLALEGGAISESTNGRIVRDILLRRDDGLWPSVQTIGASWRWRLGTKNAGPKAVWLV